MKIHGILETSLYTDDLAEAEHFYRLIPGLEFISKEEGRHIFFRCGKSMLLIFNPKTTSEPYRNSSENRIPQHGCSGQGHVAFSIKPDTEKKWKTFFRENNIEIESEVTWPNGSVSLYFRDPAGNSLELVTPEIWD